MNIKFDKKPMKISDLIEELDYIKKTYGNLIILKDDDTIAYYVSSDIKLIADGIGKLKISLE